MTVRSEILTRAEVAVDNTRELEYGPPRINLANCAELWSAYLCAKYSGLTVDRAQFDLTPEDIAHMNVLQKIARTMTGGKTLDNYIDMAGYSALAGELALEEEEE